MDGALEVESVTQRPHTGSTGLCFNVQRYSLHDGPGIRTTVFFKGCPLSCPWCHNPEGLSPEPQLELHEDRCSVCGACVDACPAPVERPAAPPMPTGFPQCIRCGSCVDACAREARRMVGDTMSVDQLMALVERDRPFYDQSGGGVTFSGGEPLMQGPFLLACLEACRERGLRTCVDTAGHAPRELVLQVAELTDLFLYDLKCVDDAVHREQLGVGVEAILGNLRALDAGGATIWVRVPLIPGFNDDKPQLESVGAFIAALERARRVHLLPYHRLGLSKADRSQPSASCRIPEPDLAAIEAAGRILRDFGLDVRVGG
jgi:pyruvate formate lyase activating enzyme